METTTPPRLGVGYFASVLEDRLAELGLTQESFAARVGVPWMAVARWCEGTGLPTVEVIGCVAGELGMPLHHITTMVEMDRMMSVLARELRRAS